MKLIILWIIVKFVIILKKKKSFVDKTENRSNLVDIILKQIEIYKVISFEDYLRKIDSKTKIQLLKEYGPSWKTYVHCTYVGENGGS